MHSLAASYKYAFVVIVAYLVELLLLTRFIGVFGPYVSPLIFFLSSMVIGIVGIRMAFLKGGSLFTTSGQIKTLRQGQMSVSSAYSKLPGDITLIICLAVSSVLIFTLVKQHPVDVNHSDIIPQTQVLVGRFLHKQFPYAIISNWGYDLFPTYEPFQWLPYIIAENMRLDYRLFGFAFLLFVCILYFSYFRKKLSGTTISLMLALFFLPVLFIFYFQSSVYYNSLENLIVGYYLLLAFAIFTDSIFLIGVALMLCLLSRYSLILWLPLFLFVIFRSKSRKQAFLVFAIFSMGFLVFYFLPFLSKDATIFMKGYQYHSAAALAEWNAQSWQQPGDKPFQLFRGLGFAGFFYDQSSGTIEEKLYKYRIVHLALSSVTVLLLTALFYLKRKQLDWRIFSIASLKISLAVFYSFIQIPYDYLFLTVIYLSIPIVIISLWYVNQSAHYRVSKVVSPDDQ